MAERPTQWSVIDTQTNAAATATQSGVAGMRHYIAAVTISASAAPAAATYAELLNGATVIDRYEIPAGAFAPIVINFDHPFRCGDGEDAVLTLGDLGSGVTGTIALKGFTVDGG